MTRILLDTNMLLVPGQFNVDIFAELERIAEGPYELVILRGVLDELSRIAASGSEDGRAAKLGLHLVAHREELLARGPLGKCKGLKIIDGSAGHVDDAIVTIADDDSFVATNDGGLRRRLVERGVRVIFLKQRQYLAAS